MMIVSGDKVGTGTYGTVYKGTLNGQPVAVKCFKSTTDESGIDLGILREIVYLKSLPRHPNVIEILLVEWYDDNTRIKAAMPLYDTDLYTYIKLNKRDLPNEAIVRCLFRAVEHIHRHGVFHRDIKPGNILLDGKGGAVLCDFSLASAFEARIDHSTTVQTLWYRAPEILLGCQSYNQDVDTWSCGCVVAALVKGEDPFRGYCDIGQLFEIFRCLGTPTAETWPQIASFPHYSAAWPKFTTKPVVHDASAALQTVIQHTLRYTDRWSPSRVLSLLQ